MAQSAQPNSQEDAMDANKAYFMVRAQVTNEADREKLDH